MAIDPTLAVSEEPYITPPGCLSFKLDDARLVEVCFFRAIGTLTPRLRTWRRLSGIVFNGYMVRHIPSIVEIDSPLLAMDAATGDHAVVMDVIGRVSQGKVLDLKGHTGKKSNGEYLMEKCKWNGVMDVISKVPQAPERWGFINCGIEKGFGGRGLARWFGR